MEEKSNIQYEYTTGKTRLGDKNIAQGVLPKFMLALFSFSNILVTYVQMEYIAGIYC